jgi:sigma-B regulation protein RsbU (phosphoserine phosphatase)
MSIASRFGLFMALTLLVVMGAAGYLLLDKSRQALTQAGRQTLSDVAALNAAEAEARQDTVDAILAECKEGRMELEEAVERLANLPAETYEDQGFSIRNGNARFHHILYTKGPGKGQEGFLLFQGDEATVLAPRALDGGQSDSLFGLILVVTAAIVVIGAGVAFAISSQVAKPIEQLVGDVFTISLGNLHHRTRVRGGGEVHRLASQINKMAAALEEGQEVEIELDKREREREVAQRVRESLLPHVKPEISGYTIGDFHVDAAEPGGDFHDYIEYDGKLALLVCEVSGKGVPGALVGATARAYLRSELARGDDIQLALQRVNRQLAADVSRGMYVTLLCVVLDPVDNTVTMACAGHKLPLIRFEASSGQVRLLQPEGIALGFDPGPIFDSRLELLRVPMEPGDRLVLANTGPVLVPNAEGVELGEKGLYRIIARNASGAPEEAAEGILTALETRIDEGEFPADISLVILGREA